MCEPLQRSTYSTNFGGNGSNSSNSYNNRKSQQFQSSASGGSAGKSSRPKYCWKFNKNKDHGVDCDYVHRCSVCDSGDHTRVNCHKRKSGGGSTPKSK